MTTIAAIADAGPSSWVLDANRSRIEFATKTMWGLATVKGTFTDASGSAEITAEGRITGQVRLGTASVKTGIGKRDEHLRSPDFFDVDRFPSIDVAVRGSVAQGTVSIRATITVKGVEREVDLPTTATVLDDGAVRLTTRTEVNRDDFGVDGNMIGMVGGRTRITADAVFTPGGVTAP